MTSRQLENLYRDQGGRYTKTGGYNFMSCYTPWGIRQLDTRYCNRIRAFGRGEKFTEYSMEYWSHYSKEPRHEPRKVVEMEWTDTYASLAKDIREDPHLHPEIKKNLMLNLRNYNKRLKSNENNTLGR